jgi:hypothetical protein
MIGIPVSAATGWGLDQAALITSSLASPRATIMSASSDNGRCIALASFHGARIQTSHSSGVVRITGIALGWIGSTIAFGDVVRSGVDQTSHGPSEVDKVQNECLLDRALASRPCRFLRRRVKRARNSAPIETVVEKGELKILLGRTPKG